MKFKKHASSAIILVTILFPLFASAQTDYVIKLSGDTLKGPIKILPSDLMDRVQVTVDGSKSFFTCLQVRSFKKDVYIYRAVQLENAVHFMRVLKDGYLSLNAFNITNQISWDGRYLRKLDGSGMEVPNLSFKKMMSKFLADCPDVKNGLESGELNKRDIERIVDLYNTFIQTRTNAAKNTPVATPLVQNEKTVAVQNLMTKVEAENFITKKDALEVLKDMQAKVSRNEPVPNYLIEGLKSYLADTPSLSSDLEAIIVLLKK